jgi:hypothetical protein
MYIYVDGVQGASGAPTIVTPTLHATTFGVGYSALIGTGYIHPGYICDLFVTEAVLTADQVRQIYASGLPVVATRNPMSLLLTGAGKGKVEGSAAGIFGLDSGGKPTFTLLNEATTINSEALTAGSVLFGNNTAGSANLLWIGSGADVGKLRFRGGTAMQVEIGTDGKLWWAGGIGNLSATGATLLAPVGATAESSAISFKRSSDSSNMGRLAAYRDSGTGVWLTLEDLNVAGGPKCLLYSDSTDLMYARIQATAAAMAYVKHTAALDGLFIVGGLAVGTSTATAEAHDPSAGDIHSSGGIYADGLVQIGDALKHLGATVGFYGTTPVTKRAHIADATDAATVITRCNAILLALEQYGLLATI